MSVRLGHGANHPVTNEWLYRQCLDGRMPAEALPTDQRAGLVRRLHRRGWTDVEIAVHMRMTLYTTARIRSGIGLDVHRPRTTPHREIA